MVAGSFFTYLFFFFKQKTAYEMRISDWSSDVCSSDLLAAAGAHPVHRHHHRLPAAVVQLRRERAARVERVPDVGAEEPGGAAPHVGAGAERLVAVGPHDHGVHVVIVTDRLPRPRGLPSHDRKSTRLNSSH